MEEIQKVKIHKKKFEVILFQHDYLSNDLWELTFVPFLKQQISSLTL